MSKGPSERVAQYGLSTPLVVWSAGNMFSTLLEEVLPENFGVPLEGDRDVGALCGSHQG